ncbi:hypothetical protein RhiJN_13665 [Ceratobasidium sp. AG-Ba]|nr:hypothetical protein RhiJN_13665 [Ceratobasidium sp. AG-Ba]QRW07830.1 hypothetical protein RhiLY_06829 [Ceratobasidium sp. AG-Ba]QRW14221.1 hypothetical protein RhiLY_13220 [Ceratobasidium sp. AG-Ba]
MSQPPKPTLTQPEKKLLIDPENTRTLLCIQEPGENSSGDAKLKAYGRIVVTIFAVDYLLDLKRWTCNTSSRTTEAEPQSALNSRRILRI